jgi:hypothetical protein
MALNEQDVIALAPDAASVAAGKKLATTGKWLSLNVHNSALWGECQGSGKNPYYTLIDRQNLAFKCSCPSRKFPCKHGLGLLLLFARESSAFTPTGELRTDVSDWLNQRQNRAAKQEEKQKAPADPEKQQKRMQLRERKVAGGVEELRLWIKDLVRQGIDGIPQNIGRFSQAITARMIDAQAPGLASELRRLQHLRYFGNNWQQPFLQILANLYLLTEAYQLADKLPEDVQQEVRTRIGWPISKEEVLKQPEVEDTWLVVSRQTEQDDRLTVERNWLWGKNTNRAALILNFYGPGQVPEQILQENTAFKSGLSFYPGKANYRALPHSAGELTPEFVPENGLTISEVQDHYTRHLTEFPLVTELPCVLGSVRILPSEGAFTLADADHHSLAVLNEESFGWEVLSVTGGDKFTAFGIKQAQGIQLLAYWFNKEFYTPDYGTGAY